MGMGPHSGLYSGQGQPYAYQGLSLTPLRMALSQPRDWPVATAGTSNCSPLPHSPCPSPNTGLTRYHPTPLYRAGCLVAGSRMRPLLGVTTLQKWEQPQPGGRPGGVGVRCGDDSGVQTPAWSNLLSA